METQHYFLIKLKLCPVIDEDMQSLSLLVHFCGKFVGEARRQAYFWYDLELYLDTRSNTPTHYRTATSLG